MSEEIDDVFEKQLGDKRRHLEGYGESRWIVLDYGDVLVHLFEPETREFYALEDLWGKGKDTPLEAAPGEVDVPPAESKVVYSDELGGGKTK